ncbi:MAG: CDP-alcohol phosphatidyltransferase family protein [Betaproteobacteria bacterium]|nr:CDP-alcohol phosphatidyltransferase family protein [Betaproteobacteria bacterium]
MTSLYALKPRFQAMLRPLVGRLASLGLTANAVTLAAMLVSIVIGLSLYFAPDKRLFFLLLPGWMLLRMTMNAIDGMLAREFGQKSTLGAYLNELSDVISDAALYLPFVHIAPFGWGSVAMIVFLSALSEMAGVLGQAVGAERRYDGPMGKSDRALVFGALGVWVGASAELPAWLFWLMPAMAAAITANIWNRIRSGLKQTCQR